MLRGCLFRRQRTGILFTRHLQRVRKLHGCTATEASVIISRSVFAGVLKKTIWTLKKTTFEEPEDFAALYGATPDRWTGVVRRILDYLKRHAYRIASNRIPLHLLAWWQLPEMPPMSEWAKPCGCLVRRRRRNMLLRYNVQPVEESYCRKAGSGVVGNPQCPGRRIHSGRTLPLSSFGSPLSGIGQSVGRLRPDRKRSGPVGDQQPRPLRIPVLAPLAGCLPLCASSHPLRTARRHGRPRLLRVQDTRTNPASPVSVMQICIRSLARPSDRSIIEVGTIPPRAGHPRYPSGPGA